MPGIVGALDAGESPETICQAIGLGDTACDFCHYVVQYIEGIFLDTQVISEIIAIVDAGICANLPGPFEAICTELVGQYVPTIVELIEQGLGPAAVCQKLNFCDSVA
jgi:hypothetical protein